MDSTADPLCWQVTLTPKHAAANGTAGQITSSVSKRIGFKEVELVREPLTDGHEGETFFFRVNGTPIFVNGARHSRFMQFPPPKPQHASSMQA